MNTKRTIYETERAVIDMESGQVVKLTNEKIIKMPNEPPYIKMYIHDLSVMLNVPKSEEELLKLVLRKLDYDGYVTLSKRYRTSICEKLGVIDQVLRNKLTKLDKSGALINSGYGEYMANPDYFARGSWADICKVKANFEMRIKYNENGRVVKTKFIGETGDAKAETEQDEIARNVL